MSQLNTRLRVNNNFNSHINIRTNDNSIIISGNSETGTVEKSFLLSDPDLTQKVSSFIEELATYQRGQVEDYVNTALDDFDSQKADLDTEVSEFLSTIN